MLSNKDVFELGKAARIKDGVVGKPLLVTGRNAFDKHFENHEEDKLQIIESRQVSHWIKGYCNVGIPTQE